MATTKQPTVTYNTAADAVLALGRIEAILTQLKTTSDEITRLWMLTRKMPEAAGMRNATVQVDEQTGNLFELLKAQRDATIDFLNRCGAPRG